MKYGVIDIGSNSVRLMISVDDVTQSKTIKTTRLAEKMGDSCVLQLEPMNRTAQAVSFFVNKAKEMGVDKVYVFATAAVRQAKNKREFLNLVKDLCSVEVDVVSGEVEASLGALGAIQNNGGIIDVGGASSEVMVLHEGKTVFSKSLDVGAVKLTDKFANNKESVLSFIEKRVEEYGQIPKTNFFGIGGTATTLASIDQKMKVYDSKLVHGYKISIQRIKEIRDMLFSMTLEQRQSLDGLQKERALVIPSGVALIYSILTKVGVQELTISEKDNLEGYLMTKRS